MPYIIIAAFFILTGCTGIPDNISPVQNFNVNRYLGKWYEIARLDHSFERDLSHVTAEYSAKKDGGIKVVNRGFNSKTNSWSQAEGKAYFVNNSTTGHLKVSFFGPFYGSYVIFDLGNDYEYSLVTSNQKSYLWLLSKTPKISKNLKNNLINKLRNLGFNTQALIFVEQSDIHNEG